MSRFQLADTFEAIADAIPDKEALVCGDERYTYAELDRRATRLAHALSARGLGRGDHVGTYLQNGSEYVTSMLAAFKLGAVPININYRYVEEELRYLFHNADLKAVVHQREFAPRIAAVRDACPLLRSLLYVEDGSGADVSAIGAVAFEAALAEGKPERAFAPRSDDDLFIIYTGGTTGMPKGVMWRHEDIFFAGLGGGNPIGKPVESRAELVAKVVAAPMQLVMMPAAPLIHGAAQLATFIAFNGGNKLIFQKRFDAREIVRLIDREKINTLSLVGDAMARPLVEALEENAREGRCDVSSLITVSSAGAIFSTPVKERLKAVKPNLILIDSYGSTETGFQGTGAGGETKSFGQGLSFAMNERTVVLDDERRIVAPGSGRRGRVALKGHVPVGYYNDPLTTAETFVQIGGERFSITGDVAEVEADGTIRLFGRGSLCINSGGEKIFIEEVENALKSAPAVHDAVVVGVDDETWGQRVTALVSLEPGCADPGEQALQQHVRTFVAGYKVPKQIFVVDEVFRGPNGKADYKLSKRLAEELAARAGSVTRRRDGPASSS
jgi:acyl-CoA synthetase (AMP-forming)/AMP-acid ligase II